MSATVAMTDKISLTADAVFKSRLAAEAKEKGITLGELIIRLVCDVKGWNAADHLPRRNPPGRPPTVEDGKRKGGATR